MAIHRLVPCALVLLAFLPSFAFAESANSEGSSAPVTKNLYQKLVKSVFEVVVPKVRDGFVVYERPLPYDRLPFKDRNDKYQAVGTAFQIEKGKYVSASHLFDPHLSVLPRDYYVRDAGGAVHKIVRFTRYSQYRDLAEFELDSEPAGVQPLPVKKNVEIGDEVFTAGNAGGEGISVRGGQVSLMTFEENDGAWKFIRFSAPASPGNSGGPLITRNGEVVGIVLRKNQNENLNFALPIDELLKASRAEAEFYLRNMAVTLDGKNLASPWKMSVALPATLAQLSDQSGRSLSDTYGKALSRLQAEQANQVFPNSASATAYLMDQDYSWVSADIGRKPNGSFALSTDGYQSSEAAPDQKIVIRKSGSSSFDFVLERPRAQPYAQFIAEPGKVLDSFLKTVGWKRSFAGDDVKILSYGAPHSLTSAKDVYGRTWIRARWHLAEMDQHLYLDCLPIPGAIACSFAQLSPTMVRLYGEAVMQAQYSRTMQSYKGKLRDWPEFLALGAKYLPDWLARGRVEFSPGRQLAFSFGSLALNYVPGAQVTPESELFLMTGINPWKRDALEVQGFRIQPRGGVSTGDSVYVFRRPPADAPAEKAKLWEALVARKAPFNGQPTTIENEHRMKWVLGGGKDRGRMPASVSPGGEQGPENSQVFVVLCTSGAEQDVRGLVPECTNFAGHLKTSP